MGTGDIRTGDMGTRVRDNTSKTLDSMGYTHTVSHTYSLVLGGDRGHGTLGTTRGKGQHIQPIGLNCKLCLNYSKETPRGSSVDLG